MNLLQLKNMNIGATVLHGSVLIVCVVWSLLKYDPVNSSSYIDTTLYTIGANYSQSVADSNENNNKVKVECKPITKHSDWLLFKLIFAFLLITCMSHFIFSITNKNWYADMLSKSNNYARWIEYSISASIMILIIMFTCGVKSFDTVLTVCITSVCVMLLGNSIEIAISENRINNALFLTGISWALFGTIWYNISHTFISAAKEATNMPSFVVAIYISMFLLYSSFGFVQLFHLSNPTTCFMKIESSYIILSFIAKTLLVMLVTSGLVARS